MLSGAAALAAAPFAWEKRMDQMELAQCLQTHSYLLTEGALGKRLKREYAIIYIDSTADPKPLCYMTNCVHPRIVYQALMQPFNRTDTVQKRFLGIQGNTSPLSYKELDNAVRLYSSEPASFAEEMTALRKISNIKIFGGCCGTDRRHMEAIAAALNRKEKAL